jgi:membrane protein implicated in regulation of membrane protease activity
MSRSRSPRAALSRMFIVAGVSCVALVITAGTSLASAGQALSNTSVAADPSRTAIAGVSLGTFVWAVIGFALLVLGLIAASRSGRRDAADVRSALLPAGSVRNVQPSIVESQGESTPSTVTV